MHNKIIASSGFTLVEIMVSLVISSFVFAGIYGVYSIQQSTYRTQGQVAELQQQLRSALDFMNRDIRMAGYDPGGVCGVNNDQGQAGLLKQNSSEFKFEYCDRDSTGAMKLHIVTYRLDGSNLRRELQIEGPPSSIQTIAEGVDAMEFLYLTGNSPLAQPWEPPPRATVAKDTRIIRLSLLLRSVYPDPRHTDMATYTPASGTAWSTLISGSANPPKDNYHRRLLVTSIELRNVGL